MHALWRDQAIDGCLCVRLEVGVMQEHKLRVEERISNTVGIHGYVCVSLQVTP